MQVTKEIDALLSLIDDPDGDVYLTVSGKLIDYGLPIKPNLEHLWENSPDEEVQSRIESIIHKLHLSDLEKEFVIWKNTADHDLLKGALLVAKFEFPEMVFQPTIDRIEKIRKNIWLELNSYLTPLENVNVINNILYDYFGLKGVASTYENLDEYFFNKVIEQKKGNSVTNTILYQILCNQLSIPSSIISFPNLFLIAFYEPTVSKNEFTKEDVHFYVDATSGHPFSQYDIDRYINRMNIDPNIDYCKPLCNKEIIQTLIQETASCYQQQAETHYKWEELMRIAEML
jgi:regulator of sirC expression with transglutaminase-like and TPR domain